MAIFYPPLIPYFYPMDVPEIYTQQLTGTGALRRYGLDATQIGFLTTNLITNYTYDDPTRMVGGTFNGTIVSVKASNCTTRGFIVLQGLTGEPTTSNGTKTFETGTFTAGDYSLSFTGWYPGIYYRVRAYAINTQGTFYGSTIQCQAPARTHVLTSVLQEIDYFEFANDAAAQAAYVSTMPNTLQCYTEPTIKTQGNSSMKVVANSGGGIILAQTGGTITYTDSNGLNPRSSPPYNGGYTVITFINSGSINVTAAGQIDYLCVAGGGAGGGWSRSATGGGGGGGYLTGTTTLTTGTKTITVGAARNDSVFDSITSVAGGRGGGQFPGGNGGSGGGGEGECQLPPGDADYLSPRQGYDGGNYVYNGLNSYAGGGGGGASAVGGNAPNSNTGGNGGEGAISTISGVSTTYSSGGGARGVLYYGVGGTGAGAGGNLYGGNATGYGCGGGGGYSTGGAGYQGIVIIRYQSSSAGQSLARTLSGVEYIVNLTSVDTVSFDMQSTRIGSNVKLSITDSGGTTSSFNSYINNPNEWETQIWDLSQIANVDKDNITTINVFMLNTDDANTFYLDNFIVSGSSGTAENIFGWT